MIYNNSTDPVFIKRIYLKTWLLRDEIESVLGQQFENGVKGGINLKKLKKQYHRSDSTKIEEKNPHNISRTSNQKKLVVIPEEKIHKGIVVISELEINNIYFFSSFNFIEGQSIVIEFLIPQKFILNAEVIYARQYNTENSIISSEKLSYRIAARFTFLKRGEKTILQKFLESISYISKKNEMGQSEDSPVLGDNNKSLVPKRA